MRVVPSYSYITLDDIDKMVTSISGWDLKRNALACAHCEAKFAALPWAVRNGDFDFNNLEEEARNMKVYLDKRYKKTELLEMAREYGKVRTNCNKPELIERIVSRRIGGGSIDKLCKNLVEEVISDHAEGTPDQYYLYRNNFNAVDQLNKQMYMFQFPKTQSEIFHIFMGMIKLVSTNTYAVARSQGCQHEIVHFMHVLSDQLIAMWQ